MQCLVYNTVYITLKYTVYSVHYSVHCTLILFFFKLILIHQLHMCIQFRCVFIAYTMQINHCFKNVNPLMIPPPPSNKKSCRPKNNKLAQNNLSSQKNIKRFPCNGVKICDCFQSTEFVYYKL